MSNLFVFPPNTYLPEILNNLQCKTLTLSFSTGPAAVPGNRSSPPLLGGGGGGPPFVYWQAGGGDLHI